MPLMSPEALLVVRWQSGPLLCRFGETKDSDLGAGNHLRRFRIKG